MSRDVSTINIVLLLLLLLLLLLFVLVTETAINIGYSCRLLKEEMEEIYVVDGETATDVRRQLQDAVSGMETKSNDDVDGMPVMPPAVQQGRRDGVGWWRRNRVDAAAVPAVGENLTGSALVVNGSSLVNLALHLHRTVRLTGYIGPLILK